MDLSYLEQFNCIGTVFDATREADFKLALKNVINSAINNTTAQVNLNDIKGKPSETNVAFSMFDSRGRLQYNYQHTLNYKGNPDTLVIDPAIKYNLVVHTIPEVRKDNISLEVGKHNIIEVDAPQGFLSLEMNGVRDRSQIPAVIRQKGDMNTIHVQYFGETEKLLVGKYDLEVLTLPRLYFSVNIQQSQESTIEVPYPGRLNYSSYHFNYAAVYKNDAGKMQWIYNIDPNKKDNYLELLPGKYSIVYREKGSTRTIQTKTKNFTIYSGENTKLELE